MTDEFSGVVLSCFMLSRLTIIYRSIAHKTGRLAHTINHGNSVFNVMGPKFCEYGLGIEIIIIIIIIIISPLT
ncbi:hypothetical protein, partial [Thiolapillus sp.]|uniref:hypothetical protein n=1 Tax=Thiolapillus sp. TaxID=2017437 RepID=UPI003AF53D87